MSYTLSVPAKTFLTGEYIALSGGPSLVVSTKQRFKLEVRKRREITQEFLTDISEEDSADIANIKVNGIHPESPAGLYIKKHEELFSTLTVKFIDPFEGSGGFGASSAQFVLVYMVVNGLFKTLSKIDDKINIQNLWDEYRELSVVGDHSDDIKPSGADVVSHVFGGISAFEWDNEKIVSIEKLFWPFEDTSFCLFKTNTKIKTHEHLNELGEENINFEALKPIAIKTIDSLKEENALNFVLSIQEFYDELNSKNLVAEKTKEYISDFMKIESVLAIKGCGALGADVLMVLCEKEHKDKVKSLGSISGLKFIADEEDIDDGFKIEYTSDFKNIGIDSIDSDSAHDISSDDGPSILPENQKINNKGLEL